MTNIMGTARMSLLVLAGLITTGLTACSEKDDTDITTTGDGGGAGDGGGGGADGGGGDGGGGGGGGSDTGIMLFGYYGEATVTVSNYDGFEEAYYVGLMGNLDCAVRSNVRGNSLSVTPCSACDWAFTVTTSGSALASNTGCDLLGISSSTASKYDGYSYSYGYQSDYYISGYGTYGVLNYYFSGYGWYAVAIADYSGTSFMYDWPAGYYYYYL